MLLVIGLFLFVCLVIVHEFGHYWAAKKSGVVVEEFGIGFPPKVWGKKLKSKMLLSINLLPLGGFVRLKGENDSATEKGSYGSATLGNKVKIMTAGVVMNLLTAILIFFVLALIGTPKLFDNQFTVPSDTITSSKEILVAGVEQNSPAEKAGLKTQDHILGLGKTPSSITEVKDIEQLPEETQKLAGQLVYISYERGGEQQMTSAQLRTTETVEASKNDNNPVGYLGITPTVYELRRSTWSAPVVAVGSAGQFTWLTLKGLGSAIASIFSGNGSQAAQQVAGPVGIFVILRDGSLLGTRFILMIIGLISLTLAIMNILPIPALDGGRLFVTLAYRAMKRPLNKEKEELIHGVGFAVLMVLFVLITVIDVRRFF
jgi:regulator of sigma E protease